MSRSVILACKHKVGELSSYQQIESVVICPVQTRPQNNSKITVNKHKHLSAVNDTVSGICVKRLGETSESGEVFRDGSRTTTPQIASLGITTLGTTTPGAMSM